MTSDELSLRCSTGQSDVIQRASYIIAVISATDRLASQLSQEQLIYVANSLCVVVYVTEGDSSRTDELSTDISQLSTHTVCEMNS